MSQVKGKVRVTSDDMVDGYRLLSLWVKDIVRLVVVRIGRGSIESEIVLAEKERETVLDYFSWERAV